MFTCKNTDSYLTRVLAALVIAVTLVFGSLTYAVTNMQAFA